MTLATVSSGFSPRAGAANSGPAGIEATKRPEMMKVKALMAKATDGGPMSSRTAPRAGPAATQAGPIVPRAPLAFARSSLATSRGVTAATLLG